MTDNLSAVIPILRIRPGRPNIQKTFRALMQLHSTMGAPANHEHSDRYYDTTPRLTNNLPTFRIEDEMKQPTIPNIRLQYEITRNTGHSSLFLAMVSVREFGVPKYGEKKGYFMFSGRSEMTRTASNRAQHRCGRRRRRPSTCTATPCT